MFVLSKTAGADAVTVDVCVSQTAGADTVTVDVYAVSDCWS